jgi:hypothetical protein
MKRPRGVGVRLTPTKYDNFNFCTEFFYMEMYTYTTIVGWRSIEGYKDGSRET